MAGRKLADAFPESPLRMIAQAVSQITRPRNFIGLGGDSRRMQRLDLARQPDAAANADVVIERLDAEPVARRKQSLFALVPDQKGEHPDQPVQTNRAPPLVSRQNYLSVSSTAVLIIAQLGSQFEVVINLAVEDDQRRAATTGHRLAARRRKVNDAQTIVPQPRDPGRIPVKAFIVRAAMALSADHRFELFVVPVASETAANAA